jgi:hypothetical protein
LARIRTVKPDFFRHEELQALNEKHPNIMLFFAGLWCQCDKAGNFRWKPNQIKLDILPFTNYNPSTYLDVLVDAAYLSRYTVDGEDYGSVLNFKKHQLIWGSETKSPLKWPENKEVQQKYVQGSTQDIGVRNQETGDIDIAPPKNRKHSFDDSPIFDKPTFRAAFPTWDKEKCRDWYARAVEYSGANGGRYLDWKLAIQAWERKDAKQSSAKPQKEKLLG